MVRRTRRRRRSSLRPQSSAEAEPQAALAAPAYDPMTRSGSRINALIPPAVKVDRPASQEHRRRQAQLEEEYFKRANMLFDNGMFDEAVKNFNSVLKLNPNEPEANYNAGLCYRSMGKFQQAVKPLLHALRARARWADAWRELGFALAKLDRAEDAEEALFTAIQSGDQENERVYERLGKVLWGLQRHADAADVFAACHAFAPENALGHYYRGRFASLNGNLAASRDHQERTVQKAPQFVDGWIALGQTQCRLGWISSAVQSFERAIAAGQSNTEASAWNVFIEQVNLSVDMAIQEAQPQIGVPKTAAEAVVQAGLKSIDEGKIDAAIQLLEAGLDHFPDHADLLLWGGAAYALNRQYDHAIQRWEPFHVFAPSDANGRLLLALGYAMTGRRQQALELNEKLEGGGAAAAIEAIPIAYDHSWTAPDAPAPPPAGDDDPEATQLEPD